MSAINHKDKRFAIGFSFPGAVRNRVKAIADIFSATFSQDRILYDDYHTAEFARPNLDTYLQELYKNETELVVIFICHAYNEREWCGVEWRALRSRLNKRDYASIMFLKVDDGEPDGYFGNVDGGIDISLKTDQEVADLILERYNINKGNPSIRPESNPYDELRTWLSNKFEERRKSHPSFKLMEIDEDLFPDGTLKLHDIEALDDANETRTVEEIVAASWNREKNHLMIEGEGGIGKTVTLLSLPDKLAPFKVPAVYVQLHELKGVKEDETIEDYIRETYFASKNTLFNQFQTLADEPWDKGPRVLLLLDGFNEITPNRRSNENTIDRRYAIGEDINRWANRSGVQIITSSRYDIHSYVPLGDNYSRILLQPLSRRTVSDYLNKLGITLPDTESQWSIIDYPLMLALYAQTQNVIDKMDKDDKIQSFRKNDSAGAIIWNYLQREIWRYRKTKNNADVLKCVLAAEAIAPCIAWQMQKEGLFRVDENTFWDFFDNAYSQITFINEKLCPPSIQRVLRRSASGVPEKSEMLLFLEDELHLFVKGKDASNNDIYTLMHQQFRDALAAMHLINRIYATPGLPDEWAETIDFYVMNYVADLASPGEADTLWERNRCLNPPNDVSTVNMLELQKRKRNYDFSELNFSSLDLRRISLVPYCLPGTKTLLLPVEKSLNKNLAVSHKTFYPDGHTSIITSISITPDGHRLISSSLDRTVRVWDMATGQCLMTFNDNHSIYCLDITLDGRLCVSGLRDGILHVWDLKTGECLKTLNGPKEDVFGLFISPDGRYCVSWHRFYTIQIWDLETGECLHALEELRGMISSLVLTPDGRRCVVGTENGRFSVWNLDDGVCLQSFKGHEEEIRCLAISPDGQRCVSGTWNGSVCIWETVSWQCLKTIDAHLGVIRCLAITPDGSRFVTGSDDKTLRVWDLESGECLAVLRGHDKWVKKVAISPSGRKCISGSHDYTLRIWDIDGGKCLKTLKGHESLIEALSITPDGRRCVSGDSDGDIRIWDIDSGECLVKIDGQDDDIRCLAIAPDNHCCVFGYGRSLCIWELDQNEILKRREVSERVISSLAITPSGHHCITGSGDGSLQIWNLDKEDSPISLEGHENWICGIAITSDGRRCITGSWDGTLRLWDIEEGICLRVIKGEGYRFDNIVITSDGLRCFCGSNSLLRVWDLESGEFIKTFEGLGDDYGLIAVTPDGRMCISVSYNKPLRVWDLETGECHKTLIEHKEKVTAIVVTPDGRMCISGSYDKTIRVWDLESGECLKTLEAQKGVVTSIAISPNGKRFVAGTSEGFLLQGIIDANPHLKSSIRVLPVSLNRVDFSESIIPIKIKRVLQQNGAVIKYKKS